VTREQIAQRCWRQCHEHFGINPLVYGEDASFFDDFFSDPLDHREMMVWVETIFMLDSEITDEEMDAVQLFRHLVDLIERKLIR
jgi:hypothetical protein